MRIEILTKENSNWNKTIEYTSKCPWKAGPYLSKMMKEYNFKEYERVVIIKDMDNIIGFCAILEEDCIENIPYYPFIGFLYIEEKYRGIRLSEKLINACSNYLIKQGFNKVYITTDHINFYEKYGFKLIDQKISKFNNLEKIFVKELNNIYLPKEIKEIVKDLKYNIDNVGRSNDLVLIYENKYVLKISSDLTNLKKEKEITDHLEKILDSCKSIYYKEENLLGYYLRTYIDGVSLIDDKYLNNPNLLISILKSVITKLRSLDNIPCSIKSTDNIGNNFVHGDLCLPNIYVNQNDELVGFIDLGNAGLGDKWYDYAWLLWSLEYNLKTDKYNQQLLKELNMEFDEEKYNLYIPKEYIKDLRGNNNG